VELTLTSDVAYVFDVDGTLTDARQKIDEDHANILYQFMAAHDVYIVTGSDYEKTDEQLNGLQDDELCMGSYQCSGNELWVQGKKIYSNNIQQTSQMFDWFNDMLHRSQCPIKTGNHVEIRSGLINFSIPGRNCTNAQRREYVEFDKANKDREHLSALFNEQFGVFDFKSAVAGETGLDITMLDMDKSQVYRKLLPVYNSIIYFGDHCLPGENDYPFVQAMEAQGRVQDNYWHVSSPSRTYEILERLNDVAV